MLRLDFNENDSLIIFSTQPEESKNGSKIIQNKTRLTPAGFCGRIQEYILNPTTKRCCTQLQTVVHTN